MNHFLKPDLRADFPHYVVRKSILFFLQEHASNFSGKVIDLGCGNMPYKHWILSQSNVEQYIGIDVSSSEYYQKAPDVIWDGVQIPFNDSSADVVLLTEVVEHLSHPDQVLAEIFRVLKPGGKLIGTTPFFWPIHEAPNDIRRFTPFGMKIVLEAAQFNVVKVVSTGGWRVSLAQFITAYIGFGVKTKFTKRFLATVFHYPVVWLSRSIRIIDEFPNTIMLNTIGFVATK